MLAVVTKLDGVNVLLFHMEQSPAGAWEYRVGEDGEAVRVQGESTVFPAPFFDREIVVWWRPVDGEWQRGAAHEFGVARATFAVGVHHPFDALKHAEVTVRALVRGHPSAWKLEMPRRMLGASGMEVVMVQGVSVMEGIGQVLREAGEFQCNGAGLSVMNTGSSQVALLPVSVAEVGKLPFRDMFMVRKSRLSDEEIELLRKEAP